jgi:hypothetical protein
MADRHSNERTAVFVFGIIFVNAILILATVYPDPTVFQYTVFRIVLALAAAGVAAFVPGFLQVTISNWLRAGGAMAVFVIVYFYSPAQLVYQPNIPKRGEEAKFVIESLTVPSVARDKIREDIKEPVRIDTTKQKDDPGVYGPIVYGVYFTIWNGHPYEKIRVSELDRRYIEKGDTVEYCCPEARSTFSLKLVHAGSSDENSPLQTTYEIPPLSSHSFKVDLEVNPGTPDRGTFEWLGLVASYSTSDGVLHQARSNKALLVGMGMLDGAYDIKGLGALERADPDAARLTAAKKAKDWLAGVDPKD